MRLKKIEDPLEVLRYFNHNDLLIEEKFDGFKVVITKSSGISTKIKAFTRRGIDFSENIPYFLHNFKFLPSGTTLLGELVFLDSKGNQSLSMIQSLVNSKPEHSLKTYKIFTQQKAKLVYYVYDILELRGKNLTKLTLRERKSALESLKIPPSSKSQIKIVKSYPFSDYKKLLKYALTHGGEGIVIKPKDSIFKYNKFEDHEPVGEWFKYKPFETEDVILNSYIFRKKEKKAIFPAYQYRKSPNGNRQGLVLFEVGKLSGLDVAKEKEVMKRIDQGETIVVEVNYQTKYPTGKIRAMGWVRDRTKEINPKDVIFRN